MHLCERRSVAESLPAVTTLYANEAATDEAVSDEDMYLRKMLITLYRENHVDNTNSH